MAMNLDAVLRIAAKVVGLEDLGALQKGLVGAEKAASEAKASFGAVVNSASWQAAAAAAAGFGVAIGLSARAAIDFESSMADVRKVVSGLENPKAFAEMKAEILDLSRQMPITAAGFAEIYAAAGQSGIAKGDLKDFATTVAQVAVAFDMTAQDAGQSLAQIKSALGLTIPELTKLGDAINYISNNSRGALTAGQLVEFMTRAGAVGKLAGMSGQQTVAFGAAMIQTGIQAEVAATSFNNMIKALSKGPSMTERQVSALQRLGYAMVTASDVEQQLTREAETASQRRLDVARRQGDQVVRVAEEQARKRIEAARDETEQLSREIGRRYRNQLQALQDGWDDEASAREDAVQDRISAQVKALEREQEVLIKAAQERARVSGGNADAEVQRIRDSYESRIDAIRDAGERELTLMRRADRDRQQMVRDRLQDQQDAEQKAAQARQKALEDEEEARLKAVKDGADRRFKAIEATEKAGLEASKARAKKIGEELAAASSQQFADRLQKDAVGTIMEVLGKIADLPKSQQISVLSDLFGDEARGLAPLLANLGELERILGLAGDKGKYTGSVLAEFQVRSETAANKIQLFQNNLQALQITVGDTVLPALVKLAEAFGPILLGLANFAAANPGITTALVAIGGLLSGLVLLAPGILAAITLLGQLKLAIVGLNLGGLIAGWLPVVASALGHLAAYFVVAATGIQLALGVAISWITGTFIPAIVALFSGPVGWTILAIAAVVAMAIAFREPIGKFLSWLGVELGKAWEAFKVWAAGLPQALSDAWDAANTATAQFLDWLNQEIENAFVAFGKLLYDGIVQPLIDGWEAGKKKTTEFFGWLGSEAGKAWKGFQQWTAGLPKALGDAWTVSKTRTTEFVNWLGRSLQDAWKALGNAFKTYVTDPIGKAWTAVVEAIPKAMKGAMNIVQGAWKAMVDGVKSGVRGLLQFVANAINSVGSAINKLISAFNQLPGADIPLIPTLSVPAFAEGGVVRRPTLAMVGDGGEAEYIIPASKMADASSRFLSGQRGAGVLSPTTSRPTTSRTTQINIRTGPVLQQQDGSRWVSLDDLERASQQTAEQVFAMLRTPEARLALGMR